jgi:hypothetical protein
MKALLAILLVLAAASMPVVPQSAVIMPVLSEQKDMGFPIGNVVVTFTDGHHEYWTKEGRASYPKVSNSGIVGFTLFSTRVENVPENNDLRLVWPDEHHKDYMADSDRPFIEGWGFADNDASVIIKSQGLHGPNAFRKYDVASGKLLGHAVVGDSPTLPDWAQPYADKY